MNTNIKAMLNELRSLKQRQMEISNELANEVMKYQGVQEALKDGLIKLNFPAPAEFLRYQKKITITNNILPSMVGIIQKLKYPLGGMMQLKEVGR